MTNKALALSSLLEYVADGVEYPDAHSRVCARYGLTGKKAEALTAEYDSHCVKESESPRNK